MARFQGSPREVLPAQKLALKAVKDVVQGLRQRRVREDGFSQDGGRNAAHHCDLDHGHDLATLDAKHRAPEDLIRRSVDDDLDESARLVTLECPSYGVHPELRHSHSSATLARLPLAQPDTP